MLSLAHHLVVNFRRLRVKGGIRIKKVESLNRNITWFTIGETDIVNGDISLVTITPDSFKHDTEVGMSTNVDSTLDPAIALFTCLVPNQVHWQGVRVYIDLAG